ncbi:MAG: TfoX/Sxy family protein [Alphaproteobacteria bacterium]
MWRIGEIGAGQAGDRNGALSRGFREFLEEQFAHLGGVSIKSMFGGLGVFRDGVMFGLAADDTLYFRVDEQESRQV